MLRTSLGEVRGGFCFGVCLLLPPLASWRSGEGEDLKKGGGWCSAEQGSAPEVG